MRLESHDAPYCESTAVVPLQCEKDNSLRHLAKGQRPSFVAQRFVGVPLRFVARRFVSVKESHLNTLYAIFLSHAGVSVMMNMAKENRYAVTS